MSTRSERSEAGPDGLADWVQIAPQGLPDGPVLLCTPGGVVVRATAQAAALLGYEGPDDLVGRQLEEVGVREGPPDGGGRPAVRTVSWSAGQLVCTVLCDVSDLTAAPAHPATGREDSLEEERADQISNAPMLDLQRAAKIGTWQLDPATDSLRLSKVFHELTGIPLRDGMTLEEFLAFVHPHDRDMVRRKVLHSVEHSLPVEFEHRFVRGDGGLRTLRVHGVVSKGRRTMLVGTAQDVSAADDQDSSGLLVDMGAAVDILARLLEGPAAEDVAVLACGIDNVRRIDHSLGYEAAADVEASVAQRLAEGLPETCIGARSPRWEKFMIVCPDTRAVGGVEALITLVSGLLRTTLPVGNHLVQLSGSIGVATPRGGGVTADDLFRHAAIAASEAQQKGFNQVVVADPDLISAADRQLPLEAQLRDALHRDELTLHYQPVVAADGSIVGAEALVRWPRPDRGVVSPGVFLPVAERSGQLHDLDQWVLRTAFRDAAGWPPVGGRPVSVAVNIAGLLPGDPDFVDLVTEAVTDSGIDWYRVELELVETDLVDLRPQNRYAMERLVERGARFAIDDFGTGYSSMARLKHLPVQTIKLDGRFVADIDSNSTDLAVSQAVCTMAHAMGHTCIAEGVETIEQLRVLRSIGMDLYQGFLFSPAVPAEDFRTMLATGAAPGYRR
ncbi:EAL domain-containing protein [Saccharopolyspora sp. NPDC000359]|uniref:putative bifunctional diguanylate cyclase/phosphodiesterase n=1 Tax=Saccharopolyspora sp. NPDC000359 TaxID=3154251 RepID=UPI00332D6179